MSAEIVLAGLTLSYERRAAVSQLSGRFAAGSLTAVVGPNGAGKSTLVKSLVGLLRPAAGQVQRGALDPRAIGYLPQAADIDRSFPLSVADVVAMGAWGQIGALRGLGHQAVGQATACLAAVGLEGFADRAIGALSNGQLQRVLFARLLLQDAPVVVLDEPFNAVDARTTADLLRLVEGWHQQGRTVIAVLHDLEQVRQHFPHTLLLARSAVAWGDTAEVLTPGNLRKARAMLDPWAASEACL